MILPIQLRFTDIDMFGHVNNNMYFQYLDMGKSQYITAVLGDLFDFRSKGLVVVNVNCQFMEVTRFDETIEVVTDVARVGDRSVTFEQKVVNPHTGAVKCACTTVMAGYDASTGESMHIPDEWRKLIEANRQARSCC